MLMALLIAGCSQDEPETLSAEEIVANSAARMTGLDGFHFAIDLSGKPVFLDGAETLSLGNAEGFYVAPDRALAAVKVLIPGLVTEVELLSIADQQWLSGLVTSDWVELPPEWGFNPASLVDANTGIISTLTGDLSSLEFGGFQTLEDGPDGKHYLVTATLDGQRIGQMSQGLIGPEEMSIQLWIVPESYELVRVTITDPNGGGEEAITIWQIDFSRFDEIVDIEPPS
jgi:hypothetical protein